MFFIFCCFSLQVCREKKVTKAKRNIVKAYVISVVFRTVIEAACVYGQVGVLLVYIFAFLHGWYVH